MKFNYDWSKEDYPESHGLTVLSTFACGGGSSMGYKLAGFKVIGANDVDPQMAELYKLNHNPDYYYLEDIREFKNRDDLPEAFYNLDILDGSPPCSTFSMSGQREKSWGKKKQFREGQIKQTLDDLFFDFLDLAEKLKPKVIIAENVKGLIQGNAKGYLVEVLKRLAAIGYIPQVFLLNAASMGVPQKRERVFVIAKRKDLDWPRLTLEFNEPEIPFKEIAGDKVGKPITPNYRKYYDKCIPGKALSTAHPTGSLFNYQKLSMNGVVPTITSTERAGFYHPKHPNRISNDSIIKAQTFPKDYNFLDKSVQYVCGMSVPPVMMAQIAHKIKEQWFDSTLQTKQIKQKQ